MRSQHVRRARANATLRAQTCPILAITCGSEVVSDPPRASGAALTGTRVAIVVGRVQVLDVTSEILPKILLGTSRRSVSDPVHCAFVDSLCSMARMRNDAVVMMKEAGYTLKARWGLEVKLGSRGYLAPKGSPPPCQCGRSLDAWRWDACLGPSRCRQRQREARLLQSERRDVGSLLQMFRGQGRGNTAGRQKAGAVATTGHAGVGLSHHQGGPSHRSLLVRSQGAKDDDSHHDDL